MYGTCEGATWTSLLTQLPGRSYRQHRLNKSLYLSASLCLYLFPLISESVMLRHETHS
eukprot:COSAG03_NODE_5913_length_1148_cov_25.023832_1_plen_57_part_10